MLSCREKRAFSETKFLHNRLASALFQNPLFQPHILFSFRRKENVNARGTREKGDRGSQGRLVRPPPDPLLSVRLTEVCAYRKISEIEKHPKGCFFLLLD